MSARYMQRVPGHTMPGQAPAYDDAGQLLPLPGRNNPAPGRAKCSCNELSEPLADGPARREWHRQHKLDVLAAAVIAEPDAARRMFFDEAGVQAALDGRPASFTDRREAERRLRTEGMKIADIAARFGLHPRTVLADLSGRKRRRAA